MSDTVTVTATGLYVMPDGQPHSWTNFTWQQEVIDEPGDTENYVAMNLVRIELMNIIGSTDRGDAAMPMGVVFGPMFSGDLTRYRVDHSPLHFADPAVDDDQVLPQVSMRVAFPYTVAGIALPTWQVQVHHIWAPNALMAYFWAWRYAQGDGEEFLLTSVLEGIHDRVDTHIYAYGGNDPGAMGEQLDMWGVPR